jgi:hypothetical protein
MWGKNVTAVAVAAVAALAVGSSAAAAAEPAAAAVRCTIAHELYAYGGSGGVNCDYSRYRVVLDCVENDGSVYHPVGPWVGRHQWSYTRCHEFAYQIAVSSEFG